LAEFSQVNGRAEGFDTRLEITTRRLFLSATYGNAKVEYVRPEQRSRSVFLAGRGQSIVLPYLEFNPPHDRRHQVGATAQLIFGRTKLGSRWQFGTGLPFTQVNGYYTGIRVESPEDTDFLSDSGSTLVSRAHPYGGRMPTYHRLDITLEHRMLLPQADLTFQVGVINVYDRNNIFEYNIFSGDRVDQLPIIPSAGLRVDLR